MICCDKRTCFFYKYHNPYSNWQHNDKHFSKNSSRKCLRCAAHSGNPPFWYAICHFKWYFGGRGLVRRMPLLEKTRFGCHYLKSKKRFRTKAVLINRILFKTNSLQFQLPKHPLK